MLTVLSTCTLQQLLAYLLTFLVYGHVIT